MTVFKHYAAYYNLLYRDKDYTAEADYIDGLIKKFHQGAKTVLDLGCGTGAHAFILAAKGYHLTGIDRSEEMLAVAHERQSALACRSRGALVFKQGDIRTIRLHCTFDIVIALFHVMSYQTTNQDLAQAFATAAAHLKGGGIMIFDCWYGPGVLSDPPVKRVKELEDDRIAVTRTAQPVMQTHENTVDVNYHIVVRDKATQKAEEFQETHRMRYLFRPEIELLLERAGLHQEAFMEFLKQEPPGPGQWSACFVARKKNSNWFLNEKK